MNREHYHEMLDTAMNNTKEGESFLPNFVQLVLNEFQENMNNLQRELNDKDNLKYTGWPIKTGLKY